MVIVATLAVTMVTRIIHRMYNECNICEGTKEESGAVRYC
jgi:hypothetical protein